jgi:hypothetical protein
VARSAHLVHVRAGLGLGRGESALLPAHGVRPLPLARVLTGDVDEREQQGMRRTTGERADLRLEQRQDEEGVVPQAEHLDGCVGCGGLDDPAVLGERPNGLLGGPVVAVVHADERLPADEVREAGAGDGSDRALLALQAARERSHGVGRPDAVDLGMGRVPAQHGAGELDDRVLQPAARTEEGDAVLTRPADRSQRCGVVGVRGAGCQPDPVDTHLGKAVDAGVGGADPDRLDVGAEHGPGGLELLVAGVGRVEVADDGDAHAHVATLRSPRGQVAGWTGRRPGTSTKRSSVVVTTVSNPAGRAVAAMNASRPRAWVVANRSVARSRTRSSIG